MKKENITTNSHIFTALVQASINANDDADIDKHYEQAKREVNELEHQYNTTLCYPFLTWGYLE